MKTIATTAAALMMLTTASWADDTKQQTAADEPIVLSDVEMDGITAGNSRESYNSLVDLIFLPPAESSPSLGSSVSEAFEYNPRSTCSRCYGG